MNGINVFNRNGDLVNYTRDELIAKLVINFKEAGSDQEEIDDLVSCSDEELAEVYDFLFTIPV